MSRTRRAQMLSLLDQVDSMNRVGQFLEMHANLDQDDFWAHSTALLALDSFAAYRTPDMLLREQLESACHVSLSAVEDSLQMSATDPCFDTQWVAEASKGVFYTALRIDEWDSSRINRSIASIADGAYKRWIATNSDDPASLYTSLAEAVFQADDLEIVPSHFTDMAQRLTRMYQEVSSSVSVQNWSLAALIMHDHASWTADVEERIVELSKTTWNSTEKELFISQVLTLQSVRTDSRVLGAIEEVEDSSTKVRVLAAIEEARS